MGSRPCLKTIRATGIGWGKKSSEGAAKARKKKRGQKLYQSLNFKTMSVVLTVSGVSGAPL